MEGERLFGKADISAVLDAQRQEMQKAVESYDADKFLNTAAEDLATFFVEKYRIDVPELDEQGITVESSETRVEITHDPRRHFIDEEPHFAPATRIIYHVPFSGDRSLFFIRPNQCGFSSPAAIVRERELQVAQEGEGLGAKEVKAEFDQILQQIKTYLGYLRRSVDPFNAQLETVALGYINSRRKRLLDMSNLTESLGFPLLKKPGESVGVFLQRKTVDLASPKASQGTYTPEPALSQAAFEDILSSISDMATVMERSPTAFARMGEEDIRWVLLVPLNSIFEGGASGETFNFDGKTDILLKMNGRCVFIGECKFWRGPAGFTAALDQLLGYLSWRDTKAALIVFNRKKSFSSVLAAIPGLCSQHHCYDRTLPQVSESSFRFIFHNPGDPNRKVHLAVLVFDVPSAPRESP